VTDKETLKRKWDAKRLKNKIADPSYFRSKAHKEVNKPKRISKKELLNYAFDPDLPSDIDEW
jgi:hypothetical protein